MPYQSRIIWIITHSAVLTQELASMATKGITQCYFTRNLIQSKYV